ncbi:MAG: penicillin-binding protein [Gaiellaceae bacterium]|jgi:penicillin-binding protein 1A|nr:penicillin-binding protein [Gaiellaceae bacterium]
MPRRKECFHEASLVRRTTGELSCPRRRYNRARSVLLRRKRSEPAVPRRRRRRIRKLRLLALVGVLGVLAVTAFAYGAIVAVGQQLSGLDPFTQQQRQQVDGYVYAGDGHTILAVLRGSQSRVLVQSDQISAWMKQAIVATEDKRFYEHRGIDIRGMARAFWADIRNSAAVQGGSTITQQFVKNQLTGSQRSITRKLKEATLAWQLEQKWTKDQILTAYLNTIYFGNGAYGVERASRTYFGHSASKLKPWEAALLAGIPADPSLYDPVAHPQAARARRTTVLRLMLQQNVIPLSDYKRYVKEPMPKPQDVQLSGVMGQSAPYFGEYVKQQLIAKLGAKQVLGGGYRVYTTIDLRLQKLASAAIHKWLPSPNGPQAALVTIDPSTGAVLAMVGGANFHQSQFNLAVQGERQPGSAFKPFVLATALKQGIAPQTTFVSKPVSIFLGDRYWNVHNYEGEYLGPIDLTKAIAASDNAVFAQLTRVVGPANVATTAHQLGITGHLDGVFSIGLGTQAVNPLEMARAYGSFANGGYRIDGKTFGNEPRAVTKIDDVTGKQVYDNAPVKKQVLTPAEDELLTQLLQGVVTSGTGTAAALPDRPVAGKTGTTENYGDAWFVGYTPQLVTAVWVGYPNSLKPMLTEYHGTPVAGGTFPAQIWKTFTESALKTLHAAPETFATPPYLSVVTRSVTYRDGRTELDNGQCTDTTLVVYFTGHGPPKTASCRLNEVQVPNVVGLSVSSARARLAAQPLTAQLIYKPAVPGQRVGLVLRQFPKTGSLSSYDKVTLVLAKPLHGLVPSTVGMSLRAARATLFQRKLLPTVSFAAAKSKGKAGVVLSQSPRGGVAAAPGMKVRLVVTRSGP